MKPAAQRSTPDWDTHAAAAVEALLNGPGYYLVENVFSPAQLNEANRIINAHSDTARTATHFHGEHKDKIALQRRVWNLLNKGRVFIDMVQHPLVMKTFSPILGRRFILGSFAANRLLPGAPGQEPHIDYPYWDLHDTAEFPIGIHAGFHMNCQSLISLHEFTQENGATALVPGSQTRAVYPTAQQFAAEHIRLTCAPGSLLVFTGLIWHCSMPNDSSSERTSILGQYLPKFVKPMEALDRSIDPQVRDTASPELRQLLGLDLRYPELLEESAPTNTEGRTT